MSRNAWLTQPGFQFEDLECVQFWIPPQEGWLAALRGALLLLTEPDNWELGPDAEAETVVATVEAWRSLFDNYWTMEEPCDVANPVGQIFAWAGNTAPQNTLACDGSEVSQSTYPELYAILGTLWGSASSGNFRLPDLASRMPIGVGSGSGLSTYAVADEGGEESHTLVESELPSVSVDLAHDHGLTGLEEFDFSYTIGGTTTNRLKLPAGAGNTLTVPTDSATLSADFGSDGAHENRPPFAAVLFCIWALP